MRRNLRFGAMSLLIIGLGGIFFVKAEVGEISLAIIPGKLIIGNSGNISLPSIISGTSYQINQTLPANIFMVEDLLLSASGYYTSIQTSDLKYATEKISAENIFLQSQATPTTILGLPNPFVLFGNALTPNPENLQHPQTYFYRTPGSAGLVGLGRYSDTPNIRIQVPANQNGGIYRATLYYILFDKSQF